MQDGDRRKRTTPPFEVQMRVSFEIRDPKKWKAQNKKEKRITPFFEHPFFVRRRGSSLDVI